MMTVAVNDTIERYTISGAGPYPYTWRIFNNTDLQVYALSLASPPVPTLLTYLTHYTVSGVNDAAGGSITLLTAAFTPYAGFTLDIRANTPENQPTSIRNIGRFLPEIHEDAYDYLSRQIQDLNRKVEAKIGYPDNELISGTVPSATARKGFYLFWDAVTGALTTAVLSATTMTASIIAALFSSVPTALSIYPRETWEAAANITNFTKEPGDVHRYGVVGNGVTDDTIAIQGVFTLALAQGGYFWFDGTKTYKCNDGLTLQSTVVPASQKPIWIDGRNAQLDFSGLTLSEIGLTLGATTLNNSHQANLVRFGNFRVLGPTTNGYPNTYASYGTNRTVGVSLRFCTHWLFDPMFIVAFFKGTSTFWSWSNTHTNWHVRNCWINGHITDQSTTSLWSNCVFTQGSSVNLLLQGTDTILGQVFNNCRFENGANHVHIDADPASASGPYPIRYISFNDCYYETAASDYFRVGIDYTESADPTVRGATNSSARTTGVRVIGGIWSNNVLNPAGGQAAFCFDSAGGRNDFVNNFRFEGPISLRQRCRGRPSKSAWLETRNAQHSGDDIEYFETGQFYANLTMTAGSVTLNRFGGSILSVAHVSNGVFDVTFVEPYTAAQEYSVFGTADNAVVTASNTSTTVCRVTVRDFAGAAAFSANITLQGNGRYA